MPQYETMPQMVKFDKPRGQATGAVRMEMAGNMPGHPAVSLRVNVERWRQRGGLTTT